MSSAQDTEHDSVRENTRLKEALVFKWREKFDRAMTELHNKQRSSGMHLTTDSLDEN